QPAPDGPIDQLVIAQNDAVAVREVGPLPVPPLRFRSTPADAPAGVVHDPSASPGHVVAHVLRAFRVVFLAYLGVALLGSLVLERRVVDEIRTTFGGARTAAGPRGDAGHAILLQLFRKWHRLEREKPSRRTFTRSAVKL